MFSIGVFRQAVFNGIKRRLRPVLDFEFDEDIGNMCFHRLLRHE